MTDIVNVFTFTGTLIREPASRSYGNGRAMTNYTLLQEKEFQHAGATKTKKIYLPVTTFGKQAAADLANLKKGDLVKVSGEITSWYESSSKGGHNFEATTVEILGSGAIPRRPETPTEAPSDPVPSSAGDNSGDGRDEFVRQMEDAERALAQQSARGRR